MEGTENTMPIIDGKQEFLQSPSYLYYTIKGRESVALP